MRIPLLLAGGWVVVAGAITALLQETVSGTLAMDDLDAISDQLQATSSPRVDARTLSAPVFPGSRCALFDHVPPRRISGF